MFWRVGDLASGFVGFGDWLIGERSSMMMRATVAVLLGLALSPAVITAQSPAVDPIRELLTEVRALRMAMERSATVGARIQLLVARVQLQEQRIAELSRLEHELEG